MVKIAVDNILDNIHVNDEEKQHILSVLDRDKELEAKEIQRINSLKESLDELQAKASSSSYDPKICPFCSKKYWLFNSANECPRCGRMICERCRLLSFNGSPCCILCTKSLVYYCKSGEWLNSKDKNDFISSNGSILKHEKNSDNDVIYSVVNHSDEKKKQLIKTDELLDDIKLNLLESNSSSVNSYSSSKTFLELKESQEGQKLLPRLTHHAEDYIILDDYNNIETPPNLNSNKIGLDVDDNESLSMIDELSETEFENIFSTNANNPIIVRSDITQFNKDQITLKGKHANLNSEINTSDAIQKDLFSIKFKNDLDLVNPWLEFNLEDDENYKNLINKSYSDISSLDYNQTAGLDINDDDDDDLDTSIKLLAMAGQRVLSKDFTDIVNANQNIVLPSPTSQKKLNKDAKHSQIIIDKYLNEDLRVDDKHLEEFVVAKNSITDGPLTADINSNYKRDRNFEPYYKDDKYKSDNTFNSKRIFVNGTVKTSSKNINDHNSFNSDEIFKEVDNSNEFIKGSISPTLVVVNKNSILHKKKLLSDNSKEDDDIYYNTESKIKANKFLISGSSSFNDNSLDNGQIINFDSDLKEIDITYKKNVPKKLVVSAPEFLEIVTPNEISNSPGNIDSETYDDLKLRSTNYNIYNSDDDYDNNYHLNKVQSPKNNETNNKDVYLNEPYTNIVMKEGYVESSVGDIKLKHIVKNEGFIEPLESNIRLKGNNSIETQKYVNSITYNALGNSKLNENDLTYKLLTDSEVDKMALDIVAGRTAHLDDRGINSIVDGNISKMDSEISIETKSMPVTNLQIQEIDIDSKIEKNKKIIMAEVHSLSSLDSFADTDKTLATSSTNKLINIGDLTSDDEVLSMKMNSNDISLHDELTMADNGIISVENFTNKLEIEDKGEVDVERINFDNSNMKLDFDQKHDTNLGAKNIDGNFKEKDLNFDLQPLSGNILNTNINNISEDVHRDVSIKVEEVSTGLESKMDKISSNIEDKKDILSVDIEGNNKIISVEEQKLNMTRQTVQVKDNVGRTTEILSPKIQKSEMTTPGIILTEEFDKSNEIFDASQKKPISVRSSTSSDINYSTNGRNLSVMSDVGSTTSLYSLGGQINNLDISGQINFGMTYDQKNEIFTVHVHECKDLAAAKNKKSNPYVKIYLRPDKNSKKKTTVKKSNLNPTYNEKFEYKITADQLKSRILSICVWHNQSFGTNIFLGERAIPMQKLEMTGANGSWYTLHSATTAQHYKSMMSLDGEKPELCFSIKLLTNIMQDGRQKSSDRTDMVQFKVKLDQAKSLPVTDNCTSFCKISIFPQVPTMLRLKTERKKSSNPLFNEELTLPIINNNDIKNWAIEIAVWQYVKKKTSECFGAIRLGLSQRGAEGWKDSTVDEVNFWKKILENPNEWQQITLPLVHLPYANSS